MSVPLNVESEIDINSIKLHWIFTPLLLPTEQLSVTAACSLNVCVNEEKP